jgi:hypothetical protein
VPLSWFATALVAAAPATAWWSAFPLRILGFAAAGCVLGMLAAEAFGRRRRLLATAEAALAGLLLARLATWYIPWSITLGGPLLLATVGWLVVDRERRRGGLLAIAVTGAVVLALLGGLYLQNWDAVQAAMNTVYPGQRRSGGGPTPLGQLFGAPAQGWFQLDSDVTWSNVSELSSAFTVCAVWAAVCLAPRAAAGLRRPLGGASGSAEGEARTSSRGDGWVLGVLVAATAVELLWSTVYLGPVGEAFPALNRVPPARAAGTVGFVAVLAVALVLSRRRRPHGWPLALVAAAVCAAVTAWAAVDLARIAPGLGLPLIVAASAAVFLVVGTLTWQPERWRWTVVAACLAGLGVAIVNPFQFGVGDLRGSDSAERMLAEGAAARAGGTYWATDGADTDILLIATGVPSLSGVQISGPDRSGWARLDPTGAQEDAWNRGGASLEISWRSGGVPEVTVGAPDQIRLIVDPCDLVDRGFAVGHVVSTTPLDSDCLTPAGEFEWISTTRYVYATDLADS